MNYYNPFQPMYSNRATQPQFNMEQFMHLAATLNRDAIEKLVVMARSQGISDADIQKGLQLINSLH